MKIYVGTCGWENVAGCLCAPEQKLQRPNQEEYNFIEEFCFLVQEGQLYTADEGMFCAIDAEDYIPTYLY